MLTALYLALVGKVPLSEVTAGLLAGLSAMALSLLLRGATEHPFRLSAPWHRLLPRLAWAVLRDVNKVALALAAAILAGHSGKAVRQSFVMHGDNAAAAGQQALAILLVSFAPNGYVLEAKRKALRLHHLTDAEPAADRQWPI